jgi:hypothetical protein
MEEIQLARWKLFKKSKSSTDTKIKEINISSEESSNDSASQKENNDSESEINEKSPITDYHETLYSIDKKPKKKRLSSKKQKEDNHWKRRSWESAHTIEKNVDTIHMKKRLYTTTSTDNAIERKVDRLVDKRKPEPIEVPEGYEVKVNKRTGLRYLKKKK